MICCETSPEVPNLADDLKQKALKEVRQKGVIRNMVVLIKCANPYAIENVVIFKEQNTYKIFDCGNLVFSMVYNDLKRYICGDWTDKLSVEARAIKAQRAHIKTKDQKQSLSNRLAAHNYVVC